MDDDQRRDDDISDATADHPTPDDALEPVGDRFNPLLDEEALAGDGSSPATPAPDSPAERPLAEDDPELDYNRDEHESYDTGIGVASGAYDNEEIEHDRPERSNRKKNKATDLLNLYIFDPCLL